MSDVTKKPVAMGHLDSSAINVQKDISRIQEMVSA